MPILSSIRSSFLATVLLSHLRHARIFQCSSQKVLGKNMLHKTRGISTEENKREGVVPGMSTVGQG